MKNKTTTVFLEHEEYEKLAFYIATLVNIIDPHIDDVEAYEILLGVFETHGPCLECLEEVAKSILNTRFDSKIDTIH